MKRANEKAKKALFDEIGYHPSPEQAVAHYDPAQVRLVAGGVRSGKSYSSAAELVANVSFGELFWLVAPNYELAQPEFRQTIHWLAKLGWLDEDDVMMPFTGQWRARVLGRIGLVSKSAYDARKVAAEAPDGIVVCEPGQMTYDVYEAILQRATEKRAWIWFAGTFEGSLHWYAYKYNEWQHDNLLGAKSFSIPTWANEVVFPMGRDDPWFIAMAGEMTTEMFQERFAGVPCPPAGLVFKEFNTEHHVSEEAEYRPNSPVYLWIDPGYEHAYAVLAVQVYHDDDVRVIDEVYVRGMYTEEVIGVCSQKPWWKDRANRGSVIDRAGAAKTSRGPSDAIVWKRDAGIRLNFRPVKVPEGIMRTHTFLGMSDRTGHPRLRFSVRCKGLLAEAGAGKPPLPGVGPYVYRTDDAGVALSENPIDRNNDAWKAVAYGLVNTFGTGKRPKLGTAGRPVNYLEEYYAQR